jgi:BlaI family transcriptional regulator, penicillinase repressor
MPAPALSDSEWLVMETLWESAPRTASEVARCLRERTGWADNTVRTLLSRLVEKGAARTTDGATGARQFHPAVRREALVRVEGRSFMERVFGGSAKPLLAHFAENARLTPEEVRELKRLLDQTLKKQS